MFALLGYLRVLPRHRVFVLPDEFSGTVTVAFDPVHGTTFNHRPFNCGKTTIVVPPSGNLSIADWDEYGGMSSETFQRASGTVLDGTHPWTASPRRVTTHGTCSRSAETHETFLRSVQGVASMVMYSSFDVLP